MFTFKDGGRSGLPNVDALPELGLSDKGQMRFLTTDSKPYIWNGTAWEPVGGGAISFTPGLQIFSSPVNPWVISHNRGYAPVLMAIDSVGNEVLGDVLHAADFLTTTITWSGAFSGRVYYY